MDIQFYKSYNGAPNTLFTCLYPRVLPRNNGHDYFLGLSWLESLVSFFFQHFNVMWWWGKKRRNIFRFATCGRSRYPKSWSYLPSWRQHLKVAKYLKLYTAKLKTIINQDLQVEFSGYGGGVGVYLKKGDYFKSIDKIWKICEPKIFVLLHSAIKFQRYTCIILFQRDNLISERLSYFRDIILNSLY